MKNTYVNAQNAAAITAKTTLSEVLTILDLKPGQKRKGKTPTRAKLIGSAEPIVKMCDITLYATGYALYENGLGRHSVVWLPYCTSFTYYFNKLRDAEKDYLKETADVSGDELMASAWIAMVAFFGEERITQSMDRGFGNADLSADCYDEGDKSEYETECEDMEGRLFVWDDEVLGADPLDVVIRRETREEMLAAMTDKQREVFVLYHKYGWTQQQIADHLSLDQSTVRDRLRYATKKAQKYFS